MSSIAEILIPTEWLADHLDDPGMRIVDCRFSFDHDASTDFSQGHIPGAVHAKLQEDLASPNGPIHFALRIPSDSPLR